MIGSEISSNYRITEKIGEGGMATVYKASHKTLPNLTRAIKMLNPDLGLRADIRTKFINEFSAMDSLTHPGIVRIYDFIEDGGNLYLVMEYVKGVSLDEMIKNQTGPISEQRTLKIFSKILEAIAYAHSIGIIHRDIKPSNIIITANDEPKIIDFGIVKILEDDHNSGKTQTGTQIGTLLYMSPEQIIGRGIDQRSDIYALGVTLFQMITGKAPYDHSLSGFEIQTKIVNEALPRIKDIYPPAGDNLQSIIDTATALNKAERYQNCSDFNQAVVAELVDDNNDPIIYFTADRTRIKKGDAIELSWQVRNGEAVRIIDSRNNIQAVDNTGKHSLVLYETTTFTIDTEDYFEELLIEVEQDAGRSDKATSVIALVIVVVIVLLLFIMSGKG